MICIFSSSRDVSTSDVIRWLHHAGISGVVRVNSDVDEPICMEVRPNYVRLKVRGQIVESNSATAIWYRKGRNWLRGQYFPFLSNVGHEFDNYVTEKLRSEEAVLSNYIHIILSKTVRTLGSSRSHDLNKLAVLDAARSVGFHTPDYCVANTLAPLEKSLGDYRRAVTKPVSDCIYFADSTGSKKGYISYTEEFLTDDLCGIPNRIGPSLVQEYIRKQFDIRVFCLQGDYFAMAILSQTDRQTTTDFRKYNDDRPNRCVPYLLPPEIVDQLGQLLTKLEMNTASVDMVLDCDGRHVFLEVNPVGQFGMVSRPCNYFLERAIARFLAGFNAEDEQ